MQVQVEVQVQVHVQGRGFAVSRYAAKYADWVPGQMRHGEVSGPVTGAGSHRTPNTRDLHVDLHMHMHADQHLDLHLDLPLHRGWTQRACGKDQAAAPEGQPYARFIE